MPALSNINLDEIKKLVVTAMISDDELFEHLVLKGGNAIDLIHQLTTRASVDLDFSMAEDFPGGPDDLKVRVENSLRKTFRQNNYEVFDLKMAEKPDHLSDEMKDFWGGYGFEFKLIDIKYFEEHRTDPQQLRKHALKIGQGQKFLIDVSRFEYTDDKLSLDFDGYVIYVYSQEMIVCEKLRALCQQMPEYGPIIKRSRPGTARARDFFDIYHLVTAFELDLSSNKAHHILRQMFKAKKVPLLFLKELHRYRDFHRSDFAAVQATVSPTVKMESYDFYFDFTLGLVERLKPLWNV